MKKAPQKLKQPLTVQVGPAQKAALERIAADRDVSVSRLIREGVALVIERYKQKGKTR